MSILPVILIIIICQHHYEVEMAVSKITKILDYGRIGVRFIAMLGIFLLSTESRPFMGPIQSPIQ
jgi:hypothetical protein